MKNVRHRRGRNGGRHHYAHYRHGGRNVGSRNVSGRKVSGRNFGGRNVSGRSFGKTGRRV
jgi:hypothetical protein